MTSAPLARARRAVSSPIPAVPPSTSTVCPASVIVPRPSPARSRLPARRRVWWRWRSLSRRNVGPGLFVEPPVEARVEHLRAIDVGDGDHDDLELHLDVRRARRATRCATADL